MSEPIEKQESPPEEAEFEPVVSVAKPKKVQTYDAPETYLTPSGKTRRRRRTKAEMEEARARGEVKPRKVRPDAAEVISEIVDEDLAELLTHTTAGIHALLAEVVDPKCALSHEQAVIEGEAIARIMNQYKLDPDGKYLPWFVLVGTLCLCETPTAMVIAGKLKQSRSGRTQTGEIVEGEILHEEIVP